MERRTRRDSSAPGRTGRLLDSRRETSLRERLAARDERALAELVEVATPWLLNIARAMLHDEDEAEEVVMEAFRTVWHNVTVPSGEQTGLMPYLMRITRHRAIDRLRARRRHARKLGAVALESTTTVPPSSIDEAGSPGGLCTSRSTLLWPHCRPISRPWSGSRISRVSLSRRSPQSSGSRSAR